jgi:dTMP kinase
VGLLTVIEGIDGSGKGTQAARLIASLQAAGVRCELFSFPRYQQTQFGAKIGDFLNGRFGSLDQVSPFLVSLLFAGDRFESKRLLLNAIHENDIVICDRYVASNIAHQAAKVTGPERQELIDWVIHVEHQLYELPHPDRTIFLDLPVSKATELIAMKAQRSYTERAADLQEADTEYLQKVHDVYVQLSTIEAGWVRIDCLNGDDIKSVDLIAESVLSVIKKDLQGVAG